MSMMSLSDTGSGRCVIMCWKSSILKDFSWTLYFFALNLTGWDSVPHKTWDKINYLESILYFVHISVQLRWKVRENFCAFELRQMLSVVIELNMKLLPRTQGLTLKSSCLKFSSSNSLNFLRHSLQKSGKKILPFFSTSHCMSTTSCSVGERPRDFMADRRSWIDMTSVLQNPEQMLLQKKIQFQSLKSLQDVFWLFLHFTIYYIFTFV